MGANDSVPWRRIAAESVAIVASILLAFALDAWWTARSDEQTELQALRHLANELNDAHVQIENQLESYEIILRVNQLVAEQLAQAGNGATTKVSHEQLAHLLMDLTYDPPIGITEMLLGSGTAFLLRNPDLVVSLAKWPAVIDDALEEQQASWRLGDEQLEPLLRESVTSLQPTYAILAMWEAQRGGEFNSGVGTDAEVQSSQELWNLIYQRIAFLQGSKSELSSAKLHLESTLKMVQSELE